MHICTDGFCILPDRTCLVSKVHVAPHMPLLLATRGLAAATWMLGAMLSQAFAGFDELVDGLADQFPNMHTRFLKCVPDSGIPAFCEMQTPIPNSTSPAGQWRASNARRISYELVMSAASTRIHSA